MKWAIAAALITAVSALRIETPASLVQCQPAAIQFADGTPPYFIAVVPGGQISATPLLQFPQQTSSPYTWNVNLPAGTNITFILTDSTGTPAYSSPTVIQQGTDSSCLNGTATSASSGASGAVSSSAGSATATNSVTSAAGGGSNTASGSASATSAATSAAQSSGSAMLNKEVTGGLISVIGLAAAAIGVIA